MGRGLESVDELPPLEVCGACTNLLCNFFSSPYGQFHRVLMTGCCIYVPTCWIYIVYEQLGMIDVTRNLVIDCRDIKT